ncbi:hypothetical protein [Hoeflea sp. 108]|jgi:hypothetical protein|uniref:DUF7674 family protein n=1 Tax=Hoeflea sp. 108 TaxID=1116369 RepID=UPI000371EB55|nr:hypothetical protein [Hoeflea sp. 108]
MITNTDMFAPMLEADPGFQDAWNTFSDKWRDHLEPPFYLALNALARHLIARLEAGDTASFDAVFDVVERWHVEGDDYVREAATIGLLEDLQNTKLHMSTDPAAFRPWLRPESLLWWEGVEDFWAGRTPLVTKRA